MKFPWWRASIVNAGWDRWARVIPSPFGWRVDSTRRVAHWHGLHCFAVVVW